MATSVSPKLMKLEGFLGGWVLRRDVDDCVEFLVMTEWASWSAIHAFARAPAERAVVDTEARAMFRDFDTHVEHFELVYESRAAPDA